MSAHKVTCGVRLDVLEGVVAAIAADLEAARVAHRMVVSGSGAWRFVDLVPREAGKLQVGRRSGALCVGVWVGVQWRRLALLQASLSLAWPDAALSAVDLIVAPSPRL